MIAATVPIHSPTNTPTPLTHPTIQPHLVAPKVQSDQVHTRLEVTGLTNTTFTEVQPLNGLQVEVARPLAYQIERDGVRRLQQSGFEPQPQESPTHLHTIQRLKDVH
jgi:hypothetical protein